MAKCLVLNTLGSITKSFSLPASDTNAKSICEKYLDGKYEVFALTSSVGADTDVEGFDHYGFMHSFYSLFPLPLARFPSFLRFFSIFPVFDHVLTPFFCFCLFYHLFLAPLS